MRPTNPRLVQERVAEWHHLEPMQIVGPSRRPHILAARLDLLVMLHELCGYSWAAAEQFCRIARGCAMRKNAEALPAEHIEELRGFINA
jgi:hypothetical protein